MGNVKSKKNNLLKAVRSISAKTNIKNIVSINDLRDKDFEGIALSEEEKKALTAYDKFRLLELNKQLSDDEFNQKYTLLQVMANMRPYQDFLDPKYDYLFYTSL